MARKSQPPSMKSLKATLLESAFDPRAQGKPMSVVVSLNDPTYCETRAIELIHEAKITPDLVQHNEKLTQAISLLALSKVQRNGAPQNP